MFDIVVAGVDDYEGGRDVLQLATTLGSDGAQITLVYVEVVQADAGSPYPAASIAERQRSGLSRLNRLREETETAVEVARVEAASLRRGLHAFAAGHGAELIVIGASKADHLTRTLMGDDVAAVLERPPCPVAVSPRGYATHPGTIRKIGVAYDGSPESRHALAVARELGSERHADTSAFMPRGGVADDPVQALRHYETEVDLLVLGAPQHPPAHRPLDLPQLQHLAHHPVSPLLVVSLTQTSPGQAAPPAGQRSSGR